MQKCQTEHIPQISFHKITIGYQIDMVQLSKQILPHSQIISMFELTHLEFTLYRVQSSTGREKF